MNSTSSAFFLKPIKAAAVVLLAAAFYGSISQAAFAYSYSVNDDLEALKIYKSRPNHNKQAEMAYQEGVDQLVKGKFRKARPMLEEAMRLDPGYAGIYGSYGYCQIWQENYTEGKDTLEKAIGLDSNKPLYFYRRALCFFSTGQMQEAVVELDRMLEKKPNDASALRLKARSYRAITNKEQNGIDCWSQLINNNAYTVEALCARGQIYAKLDAEKKAIADYQMALAIKPDAGEAFAGMAEIFYAKHDWQAAADNYTAAYVCGTDKALFCQRQRQICLDRLANKQRR